MSVFNQLALTRACLESLRATTEPFRLVVVDNGSTDDTPRFFERFDHPWPLRYERNSANHSVIAALNQAWRLSGTENVCVIHNDTELVEPTWLAGLYGVKRLRRSGRYVGRTIVHRLAVAPTVRPPWEEVAVVDSVCMCLDRDLSFAVRERGRRCLVVRAPFVHHGGGTRAREFGARPESERRDLAARREVMQRFRTKWGHRLPCDVRSRRERVTAWLRARLA